MFHLLVLFHLSWWILIGVFGESVSVTEGDSLTLNTDGTEIQEQDDVLWKFKSEDSLIAQIKRGKRIISISDGRFRDRLRLDQHTGSLTITNTTTEHAGVYKVQITGDNLASKTFNVSVYARLPTPKITKDLSQNLSSSSSLQNCSVLCSVVNVSHVTLSWLKGHSLLSSISVSDLSISLSLPLEVEDQDTNNYSCVLNNSITHRTAHLDTSALCHTDEGLPLLHIELISAAVGSLLIVALFLVCCICRKCKTAATREDRTDSSLCKSTPRATKLKIETVYENVPKRR